MTYHLTPIRIAIAKKSTSNKHQRGCGQREPSYIVGGNVNWYCHCGEHHGLCAESLQSCPVFCELLCPWVPPPRNTGVSCHAHLRGIFLTQGSNPSLFFFALPEGFFTMSTIGEAQTTVWRLLKKLKMEGPNS